jgi:hypothetical protein
MRNLFVQNRTGRWLRFFRLLAARPQVGNQDIDLGRFEIVRKWWHLVAAAKNLRAYLGLAQDSAYAGEIRPLVPTHVVNGMTMAASAGGEDISSALSLILR